MSADQEELQARMLWRGSCDAAEAAWKVWCAAGQPYAGAVHLAYVEAIKTVRRDSDNWYEAHQRWQIAAMNNEVGRW